jgi:hypothetical protein
LERAKAVSANPARGLNRMHASNLRNRLRKASTVLHPAAVNFILWADSFREAVESGFRMLTFAAGLLAGLIVGMATAWLVASGLADLAELP